MGLGRSASGPRPRALGLEHDPRCPAFGGFVLLGAAHLNLDVFNLLQDPHTARVLVVVPALSSRGGDARTAADVVCVWWGADGRRAKSLQKPRRIETSELVLLSAARSDSCRRAQMLTRTCWGFLRTWQRFRRIARPRLRPLIRLSIIFLTHTGREIPTRFARQKHCPRRSRTPERSRLVAGLRRTVRPLRRTKQSVFAPLILY